jgi:hypothetical protein
MLEYKRKYPLFSLCGLICGLCPRYQTDGKSKCPGCGGLDFHLKHPACAVINCNRKHANVEYCFHCSSYPCKRYIEPSKVDSFITYKNVISNFEKVKKVGIESFQEETNRKVEILDFLIENYNDGRRKNFYCLAVNLFSLPDLESIIQRIDSEINQLSIDKKKRIELVIELFESIAKINNIQLKLRK